MDETVDGSSSLSHLGSVREPAGAARLRSLGKPKKSLRVQTPPTRGMRRATRFTVATHQVYIIAHEPQQQPQQREGDPTPVGQ